MIRLFALCWALMAFSGPIHADDLLAEDDFSFDTSATEVESRSWLDDSRFTLQQTVGQAKKLKWLRTEARFEYETAPWEGAYIKLDNKVTYYAHKDEQARVHEEDYLHNKLQQAWLQSTTQDCFIKVGRQNLFWGNVEGTFASDVIMPLDYTEPLLTDFTSIRLSQDMLDAECFLGQQQWQFFWLPRATLDVFEHHPDTQWKALEDSLNEEWGGRFVHSWEGTDFHLMYARLYGNSPVSVIESFFPPSTTLQVSRYDFYGASVVSALGRWLVELDLGYKTDQIEAFSGDLEAVWDIAGGFEYTSSNNHAFNAGIWSFKSQPSSLGERLKRTQAWTLGWHKSYLNDELSLSFLGNYFKQDDQYQLTLQSLYQWDDFWHLGCAASYAEFGAGSPLGESGWSMTTQVKWQI